MRPPLLRVALSAALLLGTLHPVSGASYKIVGWNDLGMHCTDGSDFSVFSILPHYNVIHAQVVKDGKLVRSGTGLTVTYEAVADPTGSINKSSAGKGNFYDWVGSLYGPVLAPDQGLAGYAMPGPLNTPQRMAFEGGLNQFSAVGIPITPYDDNGTKNYYPMMRLVARDALNQVVATTDIVLPVSDEMDCRVCHASGSPTLAKPQAGWVNQTDPNKDYKLNILLLHDEREASNLEYVNALRDAGFNAGGLYRSATIDHQPVLCAKCHGSNALPGTGLAGVSPLTEAIHGYHARVADPVTHLAMDDTANRSSCYRCHPGSETRCLRGAMGSAVAPNGTMAMQCQSCHGGMSQVGTKGRVGWLDQPDCGSCHTGTATKNNGRIRYTTVFQGDGTRRKPVDRTFAVNTNTPAPGFALYRFSQGHGGLQCEACHGPTHAEYTSTHANDNVQSLKLQGHVGTIAECSVCHTQTPNTVNGGPHGMHPVGQTWVSRHEDVVERSGSAACQVCHGTDSRGTVLSRSFADRSLSAFGTKAIWRGSTIGCYRCHRGPNNDDSNPNRAPVATNLTLAVAKNTAGSVTLRATDADAGTTLTWRIVSQTAHGTVALNGTKATYRPDPGYVGSDVFTYAAWDGSTDSNLATVTVTVKP